jgi:hypothetical protein
MNVLLVVARNDFDPAFPAIIDHVQVVERGNLLLALICIRPRLLCECPQRLVTSVTRDKQKIRRTCALTAAGMAEHTTYGSAHNIPWNRHMHFNKFVRIEIKFWMLFGSCSSSVRISRLQEGCVGATHGREQQHHGSLG